MQFILNQTFTVGIWYKKRILKLPFRRFPFPLNVTKVKHSGVHYVYTLILNHLREMGLRINTVVGISRCP